jgi:N-acetylglutamate synthase-like GNAT family acetyltransferase
MQTISIESASANELHLIYALLEKNRLPTAGLAEHLSTALVARTQDQKALVGCAALEIYGTDALLRSVAIEPGFQRLGIGKQLIQAILGIAQDKKIKTVYLLTETAPKFFEQFGFQPIRRMSVAPSIQQSIEFRQLCPDSARVMKLELSPVLSKDLKGIFHVGTELL